MYVTTMGVMAYVCWDKLRIEGLGGEPMYVDLPRRNFKALTCTYRQTGNDRKERQDPCADFVCMTPSTWVFFMYPGCHILILLTATSGVWTVIHTWVR